MLFGIISKTLLTVFFKLYLQCVYVRCIVKTLPHRKGYKMTELYRARRTSVVKRARKQALKDFGKVALLSFGFWTVVYFGMWIAYS